jgi:hypothetical protein
MRKQKGDSGAMADEEKLPQIASLIPEIYYDLIARIPPGMLLVLFSLGFWLSCRKSPLTLRIDADDAFALLIVILGAAWAVGIMLSPIAYPVRRCFRGRIWRQLLADERNEALINRFGKPLGINLENRFGGWAEIIDRRLQDYVQYELEHARMILPKMEAEGILATHFLAALIILPFLNLLFLGLLDQLPHGYYWCWYFFLLAPIVGAAFVSYHYTKGLAQRLLSFLYVLESSHRFSELGQRRLWPSIRPGRRRSVPPLGP